MPKFAANLTMMFTEVPFLDRFEAAARAGFKYVEYLWPYDYPAQELKAKLNLHGLKQVLFNSLPGNIAAGEWGVSAIPGREEESRRHIDLALEYALVLECPTVLIMGGVVPPGQSRAKYKQTFIDNLRYASEKFKPHGINIVLEALSPQVKENYLMKTQDDALEIIDLVNRDNVFLQLDYYHAQNVEGNLARLTDRVKNVLYHVQIASVPDRHEPDEGEINYPFIFNKLDEIGYQGYVGCEYNPRSDTAAGLGWFQTYK
ncbi:hydroxypyruvate isomerase family protein [Bisgaard Taxon 10/6]|uniref:Hydroxypyruvate isomerase family protein n=1 Tax=Exercitatus varius TaxID=67857 RepID=A0AAW6QBV3_9PAST|nr:2-oxo-tetronate isomerase [Exercitatus varius]MDG2915680.1 hydroxypyruvate isomerase family protein [Exercitatus varius]MDG2939768.1 hydroxypyruvate isomerase family protein [Exercitatus varius]MDG2946452.1 hydroxypyruvate isomerase family protein [Exercitatus varius]MDG2948173.1 hydroxypyruvate isomerase family protein [Exercitatus varius]MDG2950939.1 hydroxypyruvate isomerase family protein [Exercitatus varius]